MIKMMAGFLFSMALAVLSFAADLSQHPCTGAKIPLTTEKAVVLAIECLYQGRVAKVDIIQLGGNNWFYQLRVLIPGGRIKTLDVNPETGLPLDPTELEALP
ncbi:hypothetical protein [Reinekea sp.]|jgi:hypothetical protein|uniref:PepSY domain-containing protein n=1 Tax=Reinekea sp. TaxID=1970455 RepID=UPI002A8221BC|nr:hypothetical protein [Reinekea sp.]